MNRSPLYAAGLATLWFGFWLFGQAFWDDDYGLWLNPAAATTYGDLIANLLRPFPADWGFSDRPATMLAFRVGHDLFGASAAVFFAIKALLAGAVVGLIVVAARALSPDRDPRWALVPAALFATAEPVFASMIWLNDVEIIAQGLVLAVLLLWTRDRSRRGTLLAVALALLAFKVKPSAKLLPLLLAVDVVASRTVKERGWIVALLVAVNVPWLALGAPDLFVPAEPGALTWHAPSAALYSKLLVGDGFWSFGKEGLPLGLIGFLSPFLLVLLVGLRRLGGGLGRLIGLWLALEVVLLGCYPDIPPHLIQRYLVATLLPLCLVVGLALEGRWRWIALGLVVLQIAVGVHGSSLRKRSQGCQIAVNDLTRARLEAEFEDVDVVLLDLPDNGGLGTPGNRYHSVASRSAGDNAKVEQLVRRGRTLLVSEGPLRSPRWRHVWTERPGPRAYWELFGRPLGRCERSVYEGM